MYIFKKEERLRRGPERTTLMSPCGFGDGGDESLVLVPTFFKIFMFF